MWITGSSSGIGEALAYELAARGALLVLSARRETELRRVQAACQRTDEHLVLPLDMLQPGKFEPAVKSVLERFGRVDILVHSAGISQRALAIDTQLAVDRQIGAGCSMPGLGVRGGGLPLPGDWLAVLAPCRAEARPTAADV